jgi:hypothetical protein
MYYYTLNIHQWLISDNTVDAVISSHSSNLCGKLELIIKQGLKGFNVCGGDGGGAS